MRSRFLRLGRPGRDEEGAALVEFSLAGLLMSLILVAVATTMSTFASTTATEIKTGQADDSTTLVMDELQNQIVSANILFNPASEGTNPGTSPDGTAIAAGFSVRLYTQVNGVPACVQWRLLDTGVLEDRTWTDTTPTTASPWRPQMNGVVNPSNTPPFVLDSSSSYGNRVLDVDLVVQTGSVATATVPVTTSLTARNAEFYQPSTSDTADCSPVPTP